MLGCMDTSAVWEADDQGTGEPPPRPVPHPAEVVVDLVETGIKKTFKLYLRNRPKAVYGQSQSDSNDPRFGQRGIDYPVSSEFLLKPVGYTKDTPFLPDIFTKNND